MILDLEQWFSECGPRTPRRVFARSLQSQKSFRGNAEVICRLQSVGIGTDGWRQCWYLSLNRDSGARCPSGHCLLPCLTVTVPKIEASFTSVSLMKQKLFNLDSYITLTFHVTKWERAGKHFYCVPRYDSCLKERHLGVQVVNWAAAKSFQSCPTLCDPIDVSPPGSPAPRILQARTLDWVAISFSNAGKWKVKVKSLSCVS